MGACVRVWRPKTRVRARVTRVTTRVRFFCGEEGVRGVCGVGGWWASGVERAASLGRVWMGFG